MSYIYGSMEWDLLKYTPEMMKDKPVSYMADSRVIFKLIKKFYLGQAYGIYRAVNAKLRKFNLQNSPIVGKLQHL